MSRETRPQMLAAIYPIRRAVNIRFWLLRKMPRPRLSSCAPWFRKRA